MMRPILLAALGCLLGWQAQAATRIKDIISVQGVRANQLVGYGLVIGLNGTGDTLRNSPFIADEWPTRLVCLPMTCKEPGSKTRSVNRPAIHVTPTCSGAGIDDNTM